MTEALKTGYDTLTTDLRRGPGGQRTPAHYLEKWKRKRGLVQRPGGGRVEKFRRISHYQGLTPQRIVADQMPRVVESEYHFYRWNIGKLLCVYCNCELVRENKTQDHVIPRAEIKRRQDFGDLDGALLGRDNLEPACIDCNSAKGDLSLLMFLATR